MVSVKTFTTTEPPTAVPPLLAPPPTATELTLMLPISGISEAKTSSPTSDAAAESETFSAASMSTPVSTYAVVVMFRTLTATAAPTPASEPSAPDAAMFCSPSLLTAPMVTDPAPVPSEVRTAPVPTTALLVTITTLTPTDPAMLTSELVPPAAASPQATVSLRCCAAVPSVGATASTVMPWPLTCAPAPIVAVLLTMTTLSAMPAPTLASALLFSAVPVPLAVASVALTERTLTAPLVPTTVRPPVIVADVVTSMTLTETAAPTPTPLEP